MAYLYLLDKVTMKFVGIQMPAAEETNYSQLYNNIINRKGSRMGKVISIWHCWLLHIFICAVVVCPPNAMNKTVSWTEKKTEILNFKKNFSILFIWYYPLRAHSFLSRMENPFQAIEKESSWWCCAMESSIREEKKTFV